MGTFKTAIENLLGYNKTTFFANKLLNANNVVFSSYGSDIHVSDIVKTAIHRVCEEVSKCSIKSVVEYRNPHRIEVQNDSIEERNSFERSAQEQLNLQHLAVLLHEIYRKIHRGG